VLLLLLLCAVLAVDTCLCAWLPALQVAWCADKGYTPLLP
jgi:hypothetical protein